MAGIPDLAWILRHVVYYVKVIIPLNKYMPVDIKDDAAITVLSSITVVAGFLGSVSIATLGQTQRMVSEYPFSSYLREVGVFDHYLFWPQFALLFQIGLLLFSAMAAISVRLIYSDDVNKYIIAVDVGLLIYVCIKTWDLVDLIRKLTWHYEEYNRLSKEYLANKDEERRVGKGA